MSTTQSSVLTASWRQSLSKGTWVGECLNGREAKSAAELPELRKHAARHGPRQASQSMTLHIYNITRDAVDEHHVV